jgi:hypothetical protein
MQQDDTAGQPGPTLKLVKPGAREQRCRAAVPVALVESIILDRAIADMDDWISGLPDASELAWSFRRAQRVLEAERADRRSHARTSARS